MQELVEFLAPYLAINLQIPERGVIPNNPTSWKETSIITIFIRGKDLFF